MENQDFKIQAWKTWKISVGHGKSWKIRFPLDQWIILSQFSLLAFSSFLGPLMNVKNIAKMGSTILVTLIYHSLAVNFNSETGSKLPLWFDGAPFQPRFVVSSFSRSWIFVNMVTESHRKVMEFWWTNSVRTLTRCSQIASLYDSSHVTKRCLHVLLLGAFTWIVILTLICIPLSYKLRQNN